MRVALIVGHYGPGTGAVCEAVGVDEFLLAEETALRTYDKLLVDEDILPLLFKLDRREMYTHIWRDYLDRVSSIKVKARWISDTAPDAFVEFHYNSESLPELIKGNEIVVDKVNPLGEVLSQSFADTLPNNPRGVKVQRLLLPKLVRKFGCKAPGALVEPGFLEEPGLGTRGRIDLAAEAVAGGIRNYARSLL